MIVATTEISIRVISRLEAGRVWVRVWIWIFPVSSTMIVGHTEIFIRIISRLEAGRVCLQRTFLYGGGGTSHYDTEEKKNLSHYDTGNPA
jgi:hypothetical protein